MVVFALVGYFALVAVLARDDMLAAQKEYQRTRYMWALHYAARCVLYVVGGALLYVAMGQL